MNRILRVDTLAPIALLLVSSTVCLGDWRAHGRYECEESPDTFCSGTYDAADCEAAHAGNMSALWPSAPSCQFEPGGPNPPPIYVDEGCTETMGPMVMRNVVVKIVYTYANGKRLGVERGGDDKAAAVAAAEAVSLEWESREDPAAPGTTFGMRDSNTRSETLVKGPVNQQIAPDMLQMAPPQMSAPEQAPQQLKPDAPELSYGTPTPGTIYAPSQCCPQPNVCCPQPIACCPQPIACCTVRPSVCVPVCCQSQPCTPQPRCRILRRLFRR